MSTELNNVYLTSGGKLALAFGTSATKIYGSVDADTVMIAAGVSVVLDGSFNRGNDVIQLSGNAASYSIVKVNASTVKITDADGTSVTIPVGSTGTHIKFADADRVLSGSSAGLLLGDQTVTSTAAALPAGTGGAEVYTLSVDSPSVTEGDTGTKTLSYKVTLDKAPTKDVTISYETLDLGTARANDDFVPAVGTITIPAGQRSAIVSITVLGDTVVEASETVVLRLSGSSLVAAVNATGTIVDNDQANLPVTYTLTGANAVNEGSTASFQLKTTGLAAGTTVGYKITGTGSAFAKSGTGTFTVDSDGNATVSVAVSDNNTIGDSGALTIELLNGQASAVTATVIDGTPTTYSAPAISTTNSGSGVQTINVAGTAAQSITLDTDQVTANNGFVIHSANAAVSVTSGALGDKITLVGNANNTIVTGAGNDVVNISGTGNNTVRVGSGDDTVVGGSGNDTIYVDAGNLSANDSIDGGAGDDTLVIAGDGNVINATNVKNIENIENIVLDGTTVTVQSVAALKGLKSISGHADTSVVTVNVSDADVVDLTALSLNTIKYLTLSGSGTVTLKADAADLTNTVAITRSGVTINLSTDVAGYKVIGAADQFNGSKTVNDTVQNLIDNKSSLGNATLVVKGVVGLSDTMALANAGVSAGKTVAMSVADLLNAAKYPDQKAALTASGTKIQVLGDATAAQAVDLVNSYGPQIEAYQNAATGNLGIHVVDTPANAGASAVNSTLQSDYVDTAVVLTEGAGITVDSAARLVSIVRTGTYTVADTAANINNAITGATLPASLSNATSVSLTTNNRTVDSTAKALELKQLGAKLSGGYDLTLSLSAALTNDDLSAIAGATKATLSKSSGEFSVSELNSILGQNAAATVNKVSDSANSLAGVTAKLANVTGDIYVSSAATVAQAAEIKSALATLFAKTGTHTIANSNGVYQNSYIVSDTKANVLADSASTVIKGADKVTVSDAMTLSEVQSLRAAADASATDRLSNSNLVYTVSDSASALASALSATDNTATVTALAGASANGVTATGTATVAQAKVLGTQYSGAVQVDSYKISDTVSKLFVSGALSTDIDATTDAALAKATALSVQGDVTVSQLGSLKGVLNAASTAIFDNKYAITDSAANVAGATRSNMVSASGITLNTAATAANLANLKLLNDDLVAADKAKVSFALSDAIANITGTDALGGTAAVIAFAKTASSITATGNASTITLSALDNLATKAGSTSYSVTLTDTATNVAALSAGVLGSSAVTKLVLSDASLLVADAKSTISTIGASAAAKLSYNLVDTYARLVASADKSVVEGALNLTASDNLTAAKAATLVGLTGAAGTVSYNLVDTYANVVAQAASIADGAGTINVSDDSLTVAQYADLLNRAGATTTVNTSVTAETLADTAANVSAASAAVLSHTSGVTLTDNGSLALSLVQAKALINGTNDGYDVTTTPAGVGVQVKIVDTAANLLKAVSDGGADNTYVLGSGSYKVATSDTAQLSVSQATSLLGISDIAATFTLKDASATLAGYANLAKAQSIVVTDATTIANADTINNANPNVTFGVITGAKADIAAYTTNASGVKVYTYASELSKATSVELNDAPTLAELVNVKAAVGSVSVKYSLSDTAAKFAAASTADLSGATAITVTGAAAKASEAAVLATYATKLSATIAVSDTAANLVANVAAIKAVSGTGSVSVSSGTVSASDYMTIAASLGNKFVATTVTDTAAAMANFVAGGYTASAYTFTTKVVDAAQAKLLTGAGVTSSNTLQVQDTAANLLTISNTSQAKYTATDVIELSIAKDLQTKFGSAASFAIATTADRFNSAYTYDTDANTGGTQLDTTALTALAKATTLTVDGVTVTLGSKNAALTAASRDTYDGKIVGTVAEINALPASIKNAAGYVIVDSVANVADAANASLVAGAAGYVVKDTAANLLGASNSVLSSGQKALGIEISDATTYKNVSDILNKTDVDSSYVKYSFSDTAYNLGTVDSAIVDAATKITVTDVATVAQATRIVDKLTASQVVKLDVVGNASDLAGMADVTNGNVIHANLLANLTAVTLDTDTTTAGLQGFATASEANTIIANAAKATVSLNIKDTAANLATAIANTGAGAKLATLQAAATVNVTGGASGTAATAAEAKQLAKITITGGYTVKGLPADLTDSTIVSLADLAKATTVWADGNPATVQQAITLTGLANFEKGAVNTADADKFKLNIEDSALNIAKYASAGLLDGLTASSTIDVNYTAALTAAQATTFAKLNTDSTKLNEELSDLKVTDTAANLLDAANATVVAAAGTITISDAVSISTLNQIKTAGGTSNYSYKLVDTASALIVAGTATVDGATSVKVLGATSAADMAIIENRAANSGTVTTVTSYEQVQGSITALKGGTDANANGINDTIENKAVVFSLTGSASVSEVKALLGDSSFDKVYSIADTASNLVDAINRDSTLSILNGATSVKLATDETATAAQAAMINGNLTNEAAFALSDTAGELNLAGHASAVANATSVVVNMDSFNDGLTAGITTAKITYVADLLNDTQAINNGQLDVLNGKAGDIIDLTGIADWDTSTSGTQSELMVGTSAASLTAGQYYVERGYYSADDGFVVSDTGTDSRLLIGTNATAGADDVIIILGVTSLTANATAGSDVNTFTFG